MTYFVTAYLIVWLAVLFYLGRLGSRQRALAQRLRLLEETSSVSRRKAA